MQIKKFFNKLSDTEKAYFTGQYLTGTSKITKPRQPAATETQRVNVAIIPFGISPAATVTIADFRRVTATVQAIKIGKLFDADLGKFGVRLDPSTAGAEAELLRPALCRVTLASATATPTTKTSNRTSRSYKSRNTRSGSIPFGRTETPGQTTDKKGNVAETAVADIDYEDARSTVEKLVRTTALTGLKASVGFKPEVWRLGKAATGAGTGVAGTFTFS